VTQKMDSSQLVKIIQSHRRDSLGYEDGDLSNQRAKAMDHYHGRPYGNEVDGRSKVVSRDLAEAVDGAMPAIMKVFVQSGAIAQFDPVGPEDEEQAQQESDYVNQVIMKDNAGFMTLHDVVKDILLLKNGYGKHWWAEEEKISTESFSGLSMDQVTQMIGQLEAEGAKVEIVEQDSETIAIPEIGPVEVFEVKLKIKRKVGKVRILATPTEELRVSKRCRGPLQESPFTEHVTRKTRSDLLEMGMDAKFVDELPAWNEPDNGQEVRARDSVTDESNSTGGSTVLDRSMDEIEYCEAYLRVDWDGDGIAELRKVVTCANQIPPGSDWNEAIEAVSITGGVAKRIPHRHVGESLDDDLAELQEILTTLKRQLNDNIYLTNNSEKVVNERVNLKDVMTSTPGGIKRVKGSEAVDGAIRALEVRSIIGDVLPVIQHYKQEKEDRSGVSRAGQGLDPDVLRDATKGAYLENLNRLSQKLEMMTRLIAETFVKELVLQVRSLLIRHQDKPRMVQLRGKWVEVNPKTWGDRTDVTVRVGLGTGNEEEKKQKLLLVTQLQDRLGPHGLVGPEQMYALFGDVVEALGFDMPEKYAMSPDSDEFKQAQAKKQGQPPPELMIEQAKGQVTLQVEQARGAQNMQAKQAELEVQSQNDQRDAAREAMRFEQEMVLRREQMAYDDQKHLREMEHKRWEKMLDAETQITIARNRDAASIDTAQIAAQTTLSAQQESASDNAVGGA
jgi:hypothetical protein